MRTASLSGFGGSYEWGCQRMLQLGIEWLKAHPDFKFDYLSLDHVYGVCSANSEPAKQLDAAMQDDPILRKYGVTGAMHQCVVGHLLIIHSKGYEHWLTVMQNNRRPEEFFDFDGTLASVPTTEYSQTMESGRYNHSICDPCWEVRQPGRTPHRLVNAQPEACCFCGNDHVSGIHVREHPDNVPCQGIGRHHGVPAIGGGR